MVDQTLLGELEGLGELLLIDAMMRLCSIEAAARMIVVDPIDGTKNFAAGSSDFVSISRSPTSGVS